MVARNLTLPNVIKLGGNFLITTVLESLGEPLLLAASSESTRMCSGRPYELTVFRADLQELRGMIASDKFLNRRASNLPLGFKDNRLAARRGGGGRGADADGELDPRSVCGRFRSGVGRGRLGCDRSHLLPGRGAGEGCQQMMPVPLKQRWLRLGRLGHLATNGSSGERKRTSDNSPNREFSDGKGTQTFVQLCQRFLNLYTRFLMRNL